MTTCEMINLWNKLHTELKQLNLEEEQMEKEMGVEPIDHWKKRIRLQTFLRKLGRIIRIRKRKNI